ncbi:DUF397 domain-containing protein [Actinomadura kijaniata]|uniref:DUF397 domain-containing protein n=1 Tax=Actinomadura kijaniata TaxID=46161 RepID=UPI003F1B7BD6
MRTRRCGMAQAQHDVDLSRTQWHKSSRSNGGEGACVELAGLPNLVAVRDQGPRQPGARIRVGGVATVRGRP